MGEEKIHSLYLQKILQATVRTSIVRYHTWKSRPAYKPQHPPQDGRIVQPYSTGFFPDGNLKRPHPPIIDIDNWVLVDWWLVVGWIRGRRT